MSSQDRRQQQLQQRLSALQEEHQAVGDQLTMTLNAADRVRLERQAASLEEQMNRIEQQLREIMQVPQGGHQQPSLRSQGGGQPPSSPESTGTGARDKATGTDRLLQLLQRCTVRIDAGDEQGTGFFVAPGLLLTCDHVVCDAREQG